MYQLIKKSILPLALLFSFSAARAQTSSGTIAGTVTDATGAAVPGATVVAVSDQTGEKRSVVTNGVGGYRIESVTPGTFNVTASAASFQKSTTAGVHVDASIITSVNEVLKAGTEETVEVSGEPPALATDTGSLSGTLGTVAVDNLPVSTMSAYGLALTLPGIQMLSNQNNFENGLGFSVNGSRARANNFLIEGSDNNDAGIHGQGIQPENLDAIDQVIVLENSYEAEFGGGGGSVSNLIFKNGSNHFHGAVWDRLFNSSLNAGDKSNFYTGQTKSKTRENVFGYDIGGFAIKDKLFFFNSLQFDHFRSSTQSTLLVPTATGVAALQSLPSNPRITNLLQAIGTLRGADDPTSVDFSCLPIAETTASTSVCPSGNSVAVGPAIRSIPADTNSPELDNKVEYIPNSKDTFVFRYIRTHFDAPYDSFNNPSQLPGFDTTQNGVTDNAGITETHIFGPNLLNDLRISYGRIGFIFDLQAATYKNPLGTAPTTSIVNGPNSEVNGFGAPGGDPQSRLHNTYQLQDALSWNIHGRHALKFGFDASDVRVRDAVPFNYFGSITYAATAGGYSGLGNYIDDYGGDSPYGTVSINYGNPIARPNIYNQNYYIQDNWKAAENLTVELGFRYQYEGSPFNTDTYPAFDINNTACTSPTVSTGGVPQFCKIRETADRSDYGPRFGFAYTPGFLNKKTVLRGGFGMFYDGLFTNIIDNTQASSPNAAAPERISSGVGRGTANFSSALVPGYFSMTPQLTDVIESMTPHILSPRTLQWNLNIQQDLGHGFTSQIGYVGTRGEHLFATDESNPPAEPYGGTRLFPELGRVLIRGNSGDSIYHSAQVEVNRNFHAGFLMRAAYTWSKFEDDVSEIFTSGNASQFAMQQYPFPRKRIDYGLSALDTRHRLVISYVYTPPVWHAEGRMKIAAAVVNGFQISGVQQFNSGNPGNVEVGYDYNGDGIGNDRPVLSNASAPQATYAFDRAFYYDGNPGLCDGPTLWYTNLPCKVVTPNQVHYIVPALGTGDNGFAPVTPAVQRNSFRTLGNQQADVSLQRTFHIHESQDLLFRAETFNLLNQGTTSIPVLTLTDINPDPSTFGPNTFGEFAPTVAGARNLRFYMKYSF